MSELPLTEYEASIVRAALTLVLDQTDLPPADRSTMQRVLDNMMPEGVGIVLRAGMSEEGPAYGRAETVYLLLQPCEDVTTATLVGVFHIGVRILREDAIRLRDTLNEMLPEDEKR